MDSLYNFLDKNAYYGLLVIILIVWAGMFLYVSNLNKKVRKLVQKSELK